MPINLDRAKEVYEYVSEHGIDKAIKYFNVSKDTIQRYMRRHGELVGNEVREAKTSFVQKNDSASVSGQAYSLEDLLEKASVDLRIWEVDTYEIKDNSWDVTMRNRDTDMSFKNGVSNGKVREISGGITKTNRQFYIKARLKKKDDAYAVIAEDVIIRIASRIVKPIEVIPSPKTVSYGVLRFTDSHIGMDTNSEGISLYPTAWDDKVQRDDFISMAMRAVNFFEDGTELHIEDLGDLVDGYNGQTSRGGHELPQNMTTEEMADLAVDLKFQLLYTIIESGRFSKVFVHNVCNDNHAGSLGYIVNSHFKTKAELSFPGVVVVDNVKKFMSHYEIGGVTHILTHGKDKKHKKFGFPAKPNPVALNFVHDYIDHYNLTGRIRFHKGDSHQQYNDYTSSHRFEWNSCMAFSPASEWVQSNYGKSIRGFVMEKINGDDVNIQPVFL